MAGTYTKTVYANKLDQVKINQLKKILNKYQLVGKCDDTKTVYQYDGCSITIYQTNKILIQGKNVVGVVKELKLPFVDYEGKKQKQDTLSSYIGCDEVGVGDYFGGIVCAAVYVDETSITKLQKLGVQDSKKLDDNQIKKLVPKIMKICQYNVAAFTPAQYNDYYQSYPNANTIKTICHNTNIVQMQKERLERNLERAMVVMDQYCTKEMYLKYLQSLHKNIYPQLQKVDVFQTKAESSYIGVAAASILARYFFLNQIQDILKFINKECRLNLKSLPLGASNKSEIKKVFDLIKSKTNNEQIFFYIIKQNFKKI